VKASRWLPHPFLSLVLALIWLLLMNSLTLGNLLLGAFLGWGIALMTTRFLVTVPAVRRPLKLLRFILMVCGDILVANLHVARLVLGPRRNLRPAFVEVPMAIEDEFILSLLTSVVSLTPGTVSAGLSPDRRCLLLHAIDAPDDAALVAQVKKRYEAPLLEIFECSAT
jgi:multicomponent K+:H+ antiporter subunit E